VSLGYTLFGKHTPTTYVPEEEHAANRGMEENETTTNAETENMHSTMTNMMAGLRGRSGDEFDQAFLQEMIVHHEGAVLMAEEALESAKHQEIKTMAEEIINAQTKEIQQMKDWQKKWYNQ
jgi:uncharacterized protein (DUF305 family)